MAITPRGEMYLVEVCIDQRYQVIHSEIYTFALGWILKYTDFFLLYCSIQHFMCE